MKNATMVLLFLIGAGLAAWAFVSLVGDLIVFNAYHTDPGEPLIVKFVGERFGQVLLRIIGFVIGITLISISGRKWR